MYKRELKKPDARDLILYRRAPIDAAIMAPAAGHAGPASARIAAAYPAGTGRLAHVLVAGRAACSPS